MPAVREVAKAMVADGLIVITQKGNVRAYVGDMLTTSLSLRAQVVDPNAFKGPIRLKLVL